MMTTKMGERDSTEEIAKAFKLFDDDNTGKINFKNLKRVAKELGENMTDEELQVQMKNPTANLIYSPLVMHHILTHGIVPAAGITYPEAVFAGND